MTSHYEIRLINTAQLSSLTRIHLLAFPKSAMTQLGTEVVYRYYDWLVNGPHPEAVRIGLFANEDMLGFCFGGRFRGATGGFVRDNRYFLMWRVVTHPWLILNPFFRDRVKVGFSILRRLRKPKPAKGVSGQVLAIPSFGILAIATHPTYQGQGVGHQLMDAAEGEARQKGFRQMHLTVHPDNHQAVRFYERLGWQRRDTEGVWQGVMEKHLSSSE